MFPTVSRERAEIEEWARRVEKIENIIKEEKEESRCSDLPVVLVPAVAAKTIVVWIVKFL